MGGGMGGMGGQTMHGGPGLGGGAGGQAGKPSAPGGQSAPMGGAFGQGGAGGQAAAALMNQLNTHNSPYQTQGLGGLASLMQHQPTGLQSYGPQSPQALPAIPTAGSGI